MNSFKEFLEEGGDGGLAYESKVRKSIKSVEQNIDNFTMLPDSGGGYASNVVDLYLIIDGINYGIEIKMDSKAQMGGSSVNYDSRSKLFSFAGKGGKNIDPNIQDLIMSKTKLLKTSVEKLINFMRLQEPLAYHKSITGLPIAATKTAWMAATKAGLLKPLNLKIPINTKFIFDHYAKKNAYYIQIGGAGLFYLKQNPLNLPIPQLSGDMNLEVRLGRGGSRINKTVSAPTASGNLRIQGRLITKNRSKYSLDNPTHVLELFG